MKGINDERNQDKRYLSEMENYEFEEKFVRKMKSRVSFSLPLHSNCQTEILNKT